MLGPWPLKEAGSELNFITKHNIKCITLKDNLYPNRLLHCDDAPSLLYLKGNENFNLPYLISIVGTRQHTVQVNRIIKELMEGLSHLNIGIISGMALGVDGIAHQTALAYKIPTWGILAHGLDQMYPLEHRKLAIELMQNGGLITESRKESIILPYCFPKRNRIVAGMSDATIVIETAIKGGSMITANLAFDYNREVFAVPGRTTDKYSQGCHNLIKTQKAQLITSAADLIYLLNWEVRKKEEKVIQKQLFVSLSEEEQKIYNFLLKGKEILDIISIECNIPIFKLSGTLLNMELKGVVKPLPGKIFEAI